MIALTRRSLCQMLLCTPALSACASTAPEPAPAPPKLPLYPNATAIKWYARGYYYEAKRRGMLVETGLRKG